MPPTTCPHCGGTYSLDYGQRGDDEYEYLKREAPPPMTDARARMAAFVRDLAALSEKHGVVIELSGDDPWFHIRPLSDGEPVKYAIDSGKLWDDGASVAVGF